MKIQSITGSGLAGMGFRILSLILLVWSGPIAIPAQQMDSAAILRNIDAAVRARFDGIAEYTATEHYAVFRNKDEVHPVAEMTVKASYKKETGKSYQIVSESGPAVIRNFVLHAILDNERHINQPDVREGAWLTTANYEMKVKPGGIQKVGGRDCAALTLTPRRRVPYLLDGTLWVDARNGEIVQIEGKAAKSSSMFTGPTHMARQYVDIDGFGQAIHARAESDSPMFGQTVVTIDYRDYQIRLQNKP